MDPENSGATESIAPVADVSSIPSAPAPEPAAVESPTPVEKPKSLNAEIRAAWDKSAGKSAADTSFTTPKGGGKTVNAPSAPITAPVSWPKEDKELFSTLPPELQKRLVERERDREADYTKKTQEIAERRKLADELEGIVGPYRDSLNLNGTTLPQLVNHLLTVQKFIQERPEQAFPWLAQNVRFDLRKLFESQNSEHVSPEVRAMQQELSQLKGHLSEQHRHAEAARRNAYINQVKSFEQEVAKFAESKDETGEAAYPFFEQAQGYITSLVPLLVKELPNASVPELLKEAYDRAVRAHPELFTKWQEREQAKSLRSQHLKQSEKIKRAERAGSSLSTAPDGQAHAKPRSNSIRDNLEFLWDGR